MLSVNPAFNNSPLQVHCTPLCSDSSWTIARIAICALKTLGVFLALTGIVCLIANLQIPAIAFLVTGVALWLIGAMIPGNEEPKLDLSYRRSYEWAVNVRENILPASVEVPVEIESVLVTNHTPVMALGREVWLQHIGNPGEAPPLPADIKAILDAPCLFWPGKKVRDTHLLALVPKEVTRKVNGVSVTEPLTLNNLDKMARSADDDTGVGLRQIAPIVLAAIGDTPNPESHWILMTKEMLPSNDLGYNIKLLDAGGYEFPTSLEAATAILLKIIHSQEALFKYPNNYFLSSDVVDIEMDDGLIGIAPTVGDYYGECHKTDLGDEGLSIIAQKGYKGKNLVGIRRL